MPWQFFFNKYMTIWKRVPRWPMQAGWGCMRRFVSLLRNFVSGTTTFCLKREEESPELSPSARSM